MGAAKYFRDPCKIYLFSFSLHKSYAICIIYAATIEIAGNAGKGCAHGTRVARKYSSSCAPEAGRVSLARYLHKKIRRKFDEGLATRRPTDEGKEGAVGQTTSLCRNRCYLRARASMNSSILTDACSVAIYRRYIFIVTGAPLLQRVLGHASEFRLHKFDFVCRRRDS